MNLFIIFLNLRYKIKGMKKHTFDVVISILMLSLLTNCQHRDVIYS